MQTIPNALRALPALSLAAFVWSPPPRRRVPDDYAAAIKHEGLENSHVMAYLDELTNGIGHRLTGSSNFVRACEWAAEEFRAMGLEVELEKWATWRQWLEPRPVDRPRHQPVEMDLQVATPAWTAGTKGLVHGKLVAMPTSEEELAEVADDLRGTYLFDLRSIPNYEPVEEGDGRRRRRSRGGIPRWLRDAAPELGIAGFVSSSRGTPEHPNRIRVFADRRSSPWLARTQPTIPRSSCGRTRRRRSGG